MRIFAALVFLCGPAGAVSPAAAPRPTPPALAELGAIAGQLGVVPDAPVAAPKAASVRRGWEREGVIVVRFFDGARKPLTLGKNKILLRIMDGRHREVLSRWVTGPEIRVEGLPVRDNPDDYYSVVAVAKGWKDTGVFPVVISAGKARDADLMLIPRKGRFDFSRVTWDHLPALAPQLAGLVAGKATTDRERFEGLVRDRPEHAASLLNIAKATSLIDVGGRSALSYYKELQWDDLSRSYAFAWVEESLLERLRADRKRFRKELAPHIFHPGATCSFKQREFGEGNVQFTFNENRKKVVDGVRLVMMETDMDLYRDDLAHFVFEVAPVLGQRGMIDPLAVYQLRWMAGRLAGAPEFDPLYDFVAE